MHKFLSASTWTKKKSMANFWARSQRIKNAFNSWRVKLINYTLKKRVCKQKRIFFRIQRFSILTFMVFFAIIIQILSKNWNPTTKNSWRVNFIEQNCSIGSKDRLRSFSFLIRNQKFPSQTVMWRHCSNFTLINYRIYLKKSPQFHNSQTMLGVI